MSQPSLSDLPAPLQTVIGRVPRLRWPLFFAFRLGTRWGDDRCSLIAGALAYFGLLSVFPIALAAVTILAGALRGNTQLLHQFATYVGQFFPGETGSQVAQTIAQASTKIAGAQSATLNLLAVGALLWSGRAYFDTLASVLNTIWPRSSPRSFLGHQLAVWGTFVGAGALFLASTAMSAALSTLQSLSGHLPQLFINRLPLLWSILGRGSSLALTLLAFWLMFRFLPHVQGKRRGRLALVAAVVSSLGWEGAKLGFARLIPGVTRYEPTYGSVAGVVVTMLWLYFASLIVLAGAECAGAWEETRSLMRGEVPEDLEDSNEKLPDEQKMPQFGE